MSALVAYYTVVIPWAPGSPTAWHPIDSAGPFATLTRGAFLTQAEAIAWGRAQLDGYPYSIQEVR